jgi:uncharacterized DUF497 family protein
MQGGANKGLALGPGYSGALLSSVFYSTFFAFWRLSRLPARPVKASVKHVCKRIDTTMLFEWDNEKARLNLKKHGISFDEAATVFYDPLSATFDDPGHSKVEHRLITIGISFQNRLLVVAHTERGNSIRVINARTATAHERKRHEG